MLPPPVRGVVRSTSALFFGLVALTSNTYDYSMYLLYTSQHEQKNFLLSFALILTLHTTVHTTYYYTAHFL